MSDLLDTIVGQMRNRLEELAPAVAEHQELSVALSKLNGTSTRLTGKRGRPKGTSHRPAEALETVRKSPGLRTSEISERIGTQNTYLYRVMPVLEAEGLVRQAPDKTWHPVST